MANFEARKIHKQMYPATHNFKNEPDGTSGMDIDFIDIDNSSGSSTVQIIANLDGHRKVLEMHDDGGRIFSIHQNLNIAFGTI